MVKLNINYLNMEACPECKCDSVEVFDGPSERSKKLGKYCARSWLVTSSGQYLFVKFMSDYAVTGDAFSASHYKAVRGKGKVTAFQAPKTGSRNKTLFPWWALISEDG